MPYWDSAPSSKTNLRLFSPPNYWQGYLDQVDADKNVVEEGCARSIERHFLNALNSTNLILLTGAGSSFAAKNKEGGKRAPGMADLLMAVKNKAGEETFANVAAIVRVGKEIANVEKLLILLSQKAAAW